VTSVFLEGLTLGFSAGIAPGPLTLLVVTQTLQFGWREGVKVAIAPLITDMPILLICLSTLTLVAKVPVALALISFAGGVFLIKMAAANWRAPELLIEDQRENPGSIMRGVLTNLLNPHPYLFWLTIGGPIVRGSQGSLWLSAVEFASGMFLMMIGTKLTIAWVAKVSRPWLKGAAYRWVLRGSSLLLLIFGLSFFRDGLIHMGLL